MTLVSVVGYNIGVSGGIVTVVGYVTLVSVGGIVSCHIGIRSEMCDIGFSGGVCDIGVSCGICHILVIDAGGICDIGVSGGMCDIDKLEGGWGT